MAATVLSQGANVIIDKNSITINARINVSFTKSNNVWFFGSSYVADLLEFCRIRYYAPHICVQNLQMIV